MVIELERLNPRYLLSGGEDMSRAKAFATLTLAAALISAQALGGITITQNNTGATYTDYTLNFDEPGGPTGFIPPDTWLLSHGLTIQAGDGNGQVEDWATLTGQPWIGTGNSYFGNFGVFMNFQPDLTEFAVQIWDPSGPPGPMGGGLAVYVFDDGVEVASLFTTPAWGGIGDEWFDITTDGGDTFDEVRILGWGFFPTTYADNLSWNVIPEPGSLMLLAAGLVTVLRRRS
jgi:hypothetical protein